MDQRKEERWLKDFLFLVFKEAKRELNIPKVVKIAKKLYLDNGYDMFDNLRDFFYDIQWNENFENIADYLVNLLVVNDSFDYILTELAYAAIMERKLANLKYLNREYGISWETMKRVLQDGRDYYEFFPTLYQSHQKMGIIKYVHEDMGLSESEDYFEGLLEVYRNHKFLDYFYEHDLLNPDSCKRHRGEIIDLFEYSKDEGNKIMARFFLSLLKK